MTTFLWDPEHYSYFDYNLTSGAKNIYTVADNTTVRDDLSGAPPGYQVAFNPAQFYPFWTGAAPASIKNDPTAVRRVYSRIAELLENREGAIAASNLQTGQQWDEPNVWPPLEYIIINGLLNVPFSSPTSSSPSYATSDNQTTEDYIWTQSLALSLAQRYLDSTYCTWRATGGSTASTPQLQGAQPGANGTMFEKYSDASTDAAGGGGEYEVVEGFGWTNGVLIWIADVFGETLETPECGELQAATAAGVKSKKRSAVELHKRDAEWVQKFV